MDINKVKKIVIISTISVLVALLLVVGGFLIAVLASGNSTIITIPGNSISAGSDDDGKSESLQLHYETPEHNKSMIAMNMLPGDSLISDYTVNVSHKEDVSLYFSMVPLKEDIKLVEVLKIKVENRDTETIIYNDAMNEMPEKLEIKLTADGETNTKVRFRITAYLDTSVGNEYQLETMQATMTWKIEDMDALFYPYENESVFDVDAIPLWLIIVLCMLALLALTGIIAFAVIAYKSRSAVEAAVAGAAGAAAAEAGSGATPEDNPGSNE